MENEIIVSEIKLAKIEIKNKAQIVEDLKKELEKYNIALTEETLKTGKDYRAKLNKIKKTIEDKRVEIKKQILVPYTEVESEFKEITDLIADSVNKLDKQAKLFEDKQKEDKMKEVEKLKELNTTEIEFSNDKWLNATYKLEDIEEEIKAFVTKTNQDLELLKDKDIIIKDFYKRTQDISATLIEEKRLEELRKKEEELKLQKEKADNELVQEILEIVKPTTIEEAFPDEIEIPTNYIIKMSLNRTEALKLKQFLVENNIEYEIKEEN